MQATIECLQAHDADGGDAILDKVRFYCSDNAADELKVARLLGLRCRNMDFEMSDTTHSRQLVLKNAMGLEPEAAIVQKLLVTGTDPEPSLANFLNYSKRFASKFQDAERADCLTALRHLGWSAQRFDSRSKPFGRIASRLDAIFTVLADEADGSGPRAKWATKLIEEIGSYKRLVLAGLLADLMHLHMKWVRDADVSDPDVDVVAEADEKFRQSIDALFLKGGIMSASCKTSFVSQVIRFIEKRKVLHFGTNVIRFDLPSNESDRFEPLQRVRTIAAGMLGLMPKHTPRTGWAQTFLAFRLPSRFEDSRRDIKRLFVKSLTRLAQQARLVDTRRALDEIVKLAPLADRSYNGGSTTREAWARAAGRFPELALARELVDLFLSCLHSTGDTERSLKEVAFQHSSKRSVMGLETVEDTVLVAIHGPSVEDIVRKLDVPGKPSRCVARGRFVPKVLQAYKATYGDFKLRRQRQVRRDAGTSHDLTARKRRRIEDGRPQPESEFLRDRESDIRALVKSVRLSVCRTTELKLLQESNPQVRFEVVSNSGSVEARAARCMVDVFGWAPHPCCEHCCCCV